MNEREVDLTEYTLTGDGAESLCYFHNKDEHKMLKLFKPAFSYELVKRDYELNSKICALHVTTPQVYEMVKHGSQYGIIFERVLNKKSICRAISQDKSTLSKHMSRFALEAKKLHQIKAKPGDFIDQRDACRNVINRCPKLNDEQKKVMLDYLDKVPIVDTVIHGDMHTGNMLVANDKYYWIDNGAFAIGDPYFDLGAMYYLFVLDAGSNFSVNQFHLDKETMHECFDVFFKVYFDNPKGEEKERIIRKLRAFSTYFIIFVITNIVCHPEDLKNLVDTINSDVWY